LVRPLVDDDRPWTNETLRRSWGSTAVARKGELLDAAVLPGFVAAEGNRRVGLLTYVRRGDEVEIVTLHVEQEGRGAGRALMDAVRALAVATGVGRMWLTTTNDNIRAILFYQRWGMDMFALSRNGVAASRRVKPSIPSTSRDGIPIRHELEFEMRLGPSHGDDPQ